MSGIITAVTDTTSDWPETPGDALRLLLEGNTRFVSGDQLHPNQDSDRRESVAPLQRPFAVLFGCSDSRLAAEIIFDRGLGDMFVVRTAGQVVGPEVLGSIEYGVSVLDTPLVAILGHDYCGAIAAALESVSSGVSPTGFVRDVVDRVKLGLLSVADDALVDPDIAVDEHIRYTTDLLVDRSALIAERVRTGRCAVVGLSYRLSEGSVRVVSSRGI
jgi:carbonic anhydrase